MVYTAKGMMFETLDGGNFKISLDVARVDEQHDTKTVVVETSEIVGKDFTEVVSIFRTRINQKFGV